MAADLEPVKPIHPPWPRRNVADREDQPHEQQPPPHPPAKKKDCSQDQPSDEAADPHVDDYA